MDDMRDTDSEMDWQSYATSDMGGQGTPERMLAGSAPDTSSGDDEETAQGSKGRVVNVICLRCRLLEIPCSRILPSCKECTDMSLDCAYIAPTDNDRLFKTAPVGTTTGNAPVVTGVWRTHNPWKYLQTSKEFLQEDVGQLHPSEDAYSVAENPLRQQPDPSQVRKLMSNYLQDVIDQYPDEADEGNQARLPLPSSELLASISNSIGRSEAEKLMRESPTRQSLNEVMSGSSLLALGILLQEYSRYLL
ncbi:hypothetical protein GGI20_001154 [Coemansia sp. BCRC 34301]|nr:hypothetical protein GGI20_001154 [Coemansia sp. BCRC 34301]